MKRGKRFSAGVLPALLCLLTILLAACGGSGGSTSNPNNSSGNGPAAASPDKQVLRYPLSSDIATFDPALVQDADSINAIQMVFTGLVQLDDKLNVVDQLAASHSVADDKVTYTFKLKDGLKFSDGTPLTANDVIYSINRTIDPATKSSVSGYLGSIKDYDQFQSGKVKTLIGDSLKAPDDKTVVIVTAKPVAYFLQQLTYSTSFVVEKKLIDTYGAKWTEHLTDGGGDGPFKVQEYSHTKGITFIPNPNYYGPKPKLQKVIFGYYDSTETNFSAYEAHQVDVTLIPPPKLADSKSKPGFINVPQLTIIYFSLNYLTKPFDNIKIRQAFALAIDKDLLATQIYKDSYTATNHIVPEGMPGYNANLTGPAGVTSTKGDKAKAQELFKEGLQEAGYKDAASLPKLNFSYYARSQSTKQFVTAVIQMWQTTLGVNVTQQTLEFNKLQDLQTGSKNNPKGLQMWRAAWGSDYPDPQDWLSIFFAKNQDYNEENYGQNNSDTATAQQAVQAKLDQADVTQDQATRLKMYNDAEQQIVNDVGWIPLFQAASQFLINPKVQNLVINSQTQFPPDDWGKIYIAQ